MNEFVLFLGSFIFVFALSFQQHNVHYQRYISAAINSTFIAALSLFMIKLGSQASLTEMIAFVAGQPLGTMVAMWLNKRKPNS